MVFRKGTFSSLVFVIFSYEFPSFSSWLVAVVDAHPISCDLRCTPAQVTARARRDPGSGRLAILNSGLHDSAVAAPWQAIRWDDSHPIFCWALRPMIRPRISALASGLPRVSHALLC